MTCEQSRKGSQKNFSINRPNELSENYLTIHRHILSMNFFPTFEALGTKKNHWRWVSPIHSSGKFRATLAYRSVAVFGRYKCRQKIWNIQINRLHLCKVLALRMYPLRKARNLAFGGVCRRLASPSKLRYGIRSNQSQKTQQCKPGFN